MVRYIHELKGWPHFRWSQERLAKRLAAVRHQQGRLIGRMERLGFTLRAEATLQTRTEEVLTSNEIEGEVLDRDQVRSSVARRLGMDIGALTPADRHVDGVVEMILDATERYDMPLTAERLFGWHAALFPTGRSGMTKITVGAWRNARSGPMQVVSGPIGRERVHYEAPIASRLKKEMRAFLDWFNTENAIDPVLKAGIAHLWFVTIHPFDDGNGRIARAIADQALARSEKRCALFSPVENHCKRQHPPRRRARSSMAVKSLRVTAIAAIVLAPHHTKSSSIQTVSDSGTPTSHPFSPLVLGVSGRFIPLPQQFYIDLKKYTKTESNRAFGAGNLLFRKT